MGRKRRKQSSEESGDSDSDYETIVVNTTQKYGLRPRKSQAFSHELIDEDENLTQSDFEDELETGTLITTVRHEANQEPPSHLYKIKEECIEELDTGDENLLDFESFIDRTEIQVHKRKVRTTDEQDIATKGRAKRSKWMMGIEQDQSDGNNEFFHFLDTRDSKVEDFITIAPALDCAADAEEEDTEPVPDIKCEISNEPVAFTESEKVFETVKEELPEDDLIKHSPVSEKDWDGLSEEESVIDTACEIVVEEKVVHSWSGITQAMADKSCFVESDDEVAVLREKAPKAAFHYLIIPKENLKSLNNVTSQHITTIEHMYNAAKRIISYPQHKSHNFLIGFNALPTMIIYNEKFLWLHLHVISDDMNFDNLMLKKQWNSIHSSVFIHPEGKIFIETETTALVNNFFL